MSDVPLDIICAILSRLSVKCLLQFRSVSKTWRALIDSPHFINLHLNQTLKTNSHPTILLLGQNPCSIDFDSLDNITPLNNPSKRDTQTEILGYCNGLICLPDYKEDLFIWNPFTQKYCKLPDSPFECVCSGYPRKGVAYGFGYDNVGDDYKVVKMLQWFLKSPPFFYVLFQVYSMKFNSWRKIEGFPYYLAYFRISGVLVAGALHWLFVRDTKSSNYCSDLIVAFDITSEENRVVPPPPHDYSDKIFWMRLEVLGGCLCVCCHVNCQNTNIDNIVDIWVMKEYGVRESWTKIISVEIPHVASPSLTKDFVPMNLARPLAYSKNCGKVLFAYGYTELFWYDFKGKTIQNVSVDDMPKFSEAIFCLGSLVQPNCSGDGRNGRRNNLREETPIP